MLRVAICDDDEEYIESLQRYILHYGRENHIGVKIKIYCSGEYLVMNLKNELPLMSGLEVAKKIKEMDDRADLVFYTSNFTSLNIKSGYEIKVSKCLKKPVSYKKIEDILNKISSKKLINNNEKIIIKNKTGIYSVHISDIIYIETIERNVLVHTLFDNIISYKKMHVFEQILKDYNFYRCHNSYIVNIEYIINVSDSSALLTTGHIILVSKYKRDQLVTLIRSV